MSYFQCQNVAEMTAGRCRRTFAATITGVAMKGVFAVALDRAFFFEMSVKDFSHLTAMKCTSTFVVTLEKASQANVRTQQPKTANTLCFSDSQYTVVSLIGSKWELAAPDAEVPFASLVIRSLADVTGSCKPGAIKSTVFTTVVVAEKMKTYERRVLSANTVALIENASQAPPPTQFPGEKDYYVSVSDIMGCGEPFTLRVKDYNIDVMNDLLADGATPTVLISNMGLFSSNSERGYSLSIFLGSCVKLLPEGATLDVIAADAAVVVNVLPHLGMAGYCDGPFSVRMVEIAEVDRVHAPQAGQKTPAKRSRDKYWAIIDREATIALVGVPTTTGCDLHVEGALFVDGKIDLSHATISKEIVHVIR